MSGIIENNGQPWELEAQMKREAHNREVQQSYKNGIQEGCRLEREEMLNFAEWLAFEVNRGGVYERLGIPLSNIKKLYVYWKSNIKDK